MALKTVSALKMYDSVHLRYIFPGPFSQRSNL